MRELPDLKPGPQSGLLGWMNGLLEMARASRVVAAPGSGIDAQAVPGGTALRLVNAEEVFYIRLTAVGAGANPPYAWLEQVPVDFSAGLWQDGFTSGTISPLKDPAYEARQTALDGSLLPMLVEAWRDRYTNQVVFRAGVCPA